MIHTSSSAASYQTTSHHSSVRCDPHIFVSCHLSDHKSPQQCQLWSTYLRQLPTITPQIKSPQLCQLWSTHLRQLSSIRTQVTSAVSAVVHTSLSAVIYQNTSHLSSVSCGPHIFVSCHLSEHVTSAVSPVIHTSSSAANNHTTN